MTNTATSFHVQPEGYHDPADARRMQQLVQAMLAERRHLALTSPDADTLAHYSRLLVRDLRRAPGVQVLAHLPSTSEILLEHVNQLLADLPMDQVVDRQSAARRPAQVLVVHDTPQLTPESLALLVRLVNDLPGANLRLVLVQGRDLAVSESLQALGPQLLHWHILPPGMSAAEAAQAERAREALRAAMLQGMGRPAAPQPAAGAALPSWVKRPAPSIAATARTRIDRPLAPAAAAPATRRGAGERTASASAKSRHNWVMLTGGLALSAALAVALGVWISTHSPAPRQLATASAGAAAPTR